MCQSSQRSVSCVASWSGLRCSHYHCYESCMQSHILAAMKGELQSDLTLLLEINESCVAFTGRSKPPVPGSNWGRYRAWGYSSHKCPASGRGRCSQPRPFRRAWPWSNLQSSDGSPPVQYRNRCADVVLFSPCFSSMLKQPLSYHYCTPPHFFFGGERRSCLVS